MVEGSGTITSDSLAGESIKEGGAFAERNPGVDASSQPSAGTTTNTTDTSGARVIPAAADKEAREAQEGWSEQGQLNAGRGLGKEAGVGPTYNTSGGSAAAGLSGGQYPGSGQGATAPEGAYVHDRTYEGGPHGKNIKEGSVPEDAPNASFTTDIGGKNDPGRAALNKFEADSAPVAGGNGPQESQVSGGGAFDGLNESRA